MRNIDIALIVDHKWRDLPGMAALAVWLEEGFGLSSELIPYSHWRQSLLWRPEVIVVTTMMGSRSRAIADAASEMGTRVVVIQGEGRPNNSELMEVGAGKGVDARGVDLWFTWSHTVRDYMVARGVLPPEKIVVGGVHRFDFYRPVLNQLLLPRAVFARRYGLDPAKPILSWATNFTNAKFHLKNQEFLLRDWKDLGLCKSPIYSEPLEFARMDYEAREATLNVMELLLRSRPQVQVVLKPHPTEEHDRYLAWVDACGAEFGPRIAFVSSEYIWDVLHAADIHIHRMCTTGVEAWFLNVPSIELHLTDYYAWSLQLKGAASEAVAGNDLVQGREGLIEMVDYYLKGGVPRQEQLAARERYIDRWLYRVDGHRCQAHAEQLARLISESLGHEGLVTDFKRFRALTRMKIKHVLSCSYRSTTRVFQRKTINHVDGIGQVDCLISDGDPGYWRERVRETLLPQIGDLVSRGIDREGRT